MGLIDWEMSILPFLDRFFPRELRESKVDEFFNLHQGGMSVQEYFVKFTQLLKYALSLVADSKDMMRRYLTGMSRLVRKECRSEILHDNMDISCIMVILTN